MQRNGVIGRASLRRAPCLVVTSLIATLVPPSAQARKAAVPVTIAAASGPTGDLARYIKHAFEEQLTPGLPSEGAYDDLLLSERNLQSIFAHDMRRAFPGSLHNVPHEPSAMIFFAPGHGTPVIDEQDENHMDNYSVGELIANAVQKVGFTCDSISSVVTDISGWGFNLYCNHSTRVYAMRSNGRVWTLADRTPRS